jgi:hypothetical protein
MMRTLALALFLAPLACSPPPVTDGGVAESVRDCARSGQQCRLRSGALGVCERRLEGVQSFLCAPQH